MTDFRQSDRAVAIESVDQLVEQFHLAGKPSARWAIGTEYEKVVVDRATGRAAPFSGPRGIETVLRTLAERFGWEPKEENGRTVALVRALAKPARLADMRANPKLAGFDLLRLPRLSVMPVPAVVWAEILRMAAA